MQQPVDPWQEIAVLIGKDKENARAAMAGRQFTPPQIRKMPLMQLHVWRWIGVAACLLLASGLAWFFWGLRPKPVPSIAEQLADTPLFGGFNEHDRIASARPIQTSMLAEQFAALAGSTWQPPAYQAGVVPTGFTVERGDPARLENKIINMIRENRLELLLRRIQQINKEI